MKILLTGGTGMVGRNIQDYAQAYTNHLVISPSSNELNLLDSHAVHLYLQESKPDIIIHAAGTVGGIQANIEDPVKFLHENALMGQNIVMASYSANIKSLLNLGSSCMYPKLASNPLTEDLILTGSLEPTNEGYALAKIMIAKLCSYVSQMNKGEYNYKTLIPCNLYGRYDKFDVVKSHMVPAAILKVHQAKLDPSKKVEIWGDGTVRREFMYAEDLADAIFFCLGNFNELPDMLNVGLGHDYTINQYYDAIAKVVGFDDGFSYDTSKPVGMRQKLVSTEKLESLGWQYKTSLEDGLRETYKYYLEIKQ